MGIQRKWTTILGRLALFAFLCLIAVGAGLWYAHRHLETWSVTAKTLPNPVSFELPRGASLIQTATQLASQGVVTDAARFRLYIRLRGSFSRFQAGTYQFIGQVTPQEVERVFVNGLIFEQIVAQFTVPEGFTLRQIIARLEANGAGDRRELERLTKDRAFLTSLGLKDVKSAEGFIYPATYTFTTQPTAEDAIRRGVKTFFENVPTGYLEAIRERGLTLTQAVTFASLIELETPADEEKPLVSEVIWRRLKDNAPIGIDAAVIYGIENYKGNITRAHLQDAKNPYNLRIHRGLPPTPIGSPSRSSLIAVVNPADEGYYYFVVDPKRGNRHNFSRTLAEHQKYVNEFVTAIRQGTRRPLRPSPEPNDQGNRKEGTDDHQKIRDKSKTR